MPWSRYRLAPLLAVALTACSGSQRGDIVEGEQVRAALQQRLGVTLETVPEVVTGATLSNVLNVYSSKPGGERILLVVFDSPAATRQILGEHGRLRGSEVLRHRNVVLLHTPTNGDARRAREVRRALADASAR